LVIARLNSSTIFCYCKHDLIIACAGYQGHATIDYASHCSSFYSLPHNVYLLASAGAAGLVEFGTDIKQLKLGSSGIIHAFA